MSKRGEQSTHSRSAKSEPLSPPETVHTPQEEAARDASDKVLQQRAWDSLPNQQLQAKNTLGGQQELGPLTAHNAEVRRTALRELFSAPGYYEELKKAIACSDSVWITAIVKKQFAQLHDPDAQAQFLRGYGKHFPDISAEDDWYMKRRPQIPILESAAAHSGTLPSGGNVLQTVIDPIPNGDRAASPRPNARQARVAAKQTGIERAMLVEKIRGEMVELSQALELHEDYDNRIRNSEAFVDFMTVSVCNRHQDLREKLCAIKTTKKPKLVEIACEIASRSGSNSAANRILPSTFKDAHKRHANAARQLLTNRK